MLYNPISPLLTQSVTYLENHILNRFCTSFHQSVTYNGMDIIMTLKQAHKIKLPFVRNLHVVS